MELYSYEFQDRNRTLKVVEASTLDEALTGFDPTNKWHITCCAKSLAVIECPQLNLVYGVRWDKVVNTTDVCPTCKGAINRPIDTDKPYSEFDLCPACKRN